MLQVNEDDIDRVTAVFAAILNGKKPDTIVLPHDYPDNEIRQMTDYINRFIDEYNETTETVYQLSNGEINFESLKGKTKISQSLKALQASLKHLTWTTKQIANGDFGHKVDFMGEFSEAFNSMAEQLDNAFKERVKTMEKLQSQVVELRKAQRAMLNILEDLKEAKSDTK
ncbi:HAMP domain-containing protein [Candidatus Magnetomonas plexicatena]|uniref:HAMP domain-containing protein n=1 Tax=Candidatus Magnetomonas plexicatena TaxID=2552947 RepID=UPI001C7467D9|nr:HAMP domain-containing protein [Nitrospirales bacterium LBB_01]